MTNKPTITLDFITPGHLYWFDIDKSEPIESATDETLARAGYVPRADLAAAVGHVRDLEGQLEIASNAGDAALLQLAAHRYQLESAESRATAALAQCARVEQQNATLREMVTEVDCLRENAVTLRRSAEHWEQRATAAERVVEAARTIAMEIRAGRVEGISELVDESLRAFLAAIDALTPAALKGSGHVSDEFAASVSPVYDTPAAAEGETCGDASSTLNPGLPCPQPKGHAGPCGNGRQMWWKDRLPVVQPARTCGECKDMGRLHCERYATSCTAWPAASDPACPAFVGKDVDNG